MIMKLKKNLNIGNMKIPESFPHRGNFFEDKILIELKCRNLHLISHEFMRGNFIITLGGQTYFIELKCTILMYVLQN